MIEEVFWTVCLTDFPHHREALAKLLPAAVRALEGGKLREFNRACTRFLEDGPVPWPRYDAHLSHWNETDPRLPEYEGGEEVASGDYRESGELLAHRIVMAFYAERDRRKYEAEAKTFPYWRLITVEDGRAHPDCVEQSRVTRHYQDEYWQAKTLPCERLYCRCSISRSEFLKGNE